MVLTAAAYKLVCAEQLPKLSFETALGEYVRGVFFLIWGVCVICCLSYFCVKLDTKVELVAVWLKFDVPYCDELGTVLAGHCGLGHLLGAEWRHVAL